MHERSITQTPRCALLVQAPEVAPKPSTSAPVSADSKGKGGGKGGKAANGHAPSSSPAAAPTKGKPKPAPSAANGSGAGAAAKQGGKGHGNVKNLAASQRDAKVVENPAVGPHLGQQLHPAVPRASRTRSSEILHGEDLPVRRELHNAPIEIIVEKC